MRNRINAGDGIAALATFGAATPANALSDTTADLWVVHAFPGTTVDVVISGAADVTLDNFAPEDVEPLVDVPAGNYQVEIFSEDGGTSLLGPADVTLEAGTSYTAVAHPNADGDLTLTPFDNDLSSIAAGESRVVVRHTAQAPAVNVLAGGDAIFSDVTSGQERVIDVPAGTYEIEVQVAADDSTAIGPVDLNFAAGTATFIHAYGANLELPYGVVMFEISGLGAGPDGVPAGTAGLVDESANPALLVGGAALVLMLALGTALVVRRTAAARG